MIVDMAQKRMINKKISVSERIAELGERGALLFTWMIPHTDDMGLLPYSPRSIKALVVPMFDYTTEEVAQYLVKMEESNLIREFVHEEKQYWQMVGFKSEQTGLKKDRQPFTILDIKLPEDAKESWRLLTSLMDSKWIPDGTETVPEVKRREDKLITVSNIGMDLLKNLPDITTDEDYKKYIATVIEKETGDKKSEELFLLIAAKFTEGFIRQTLSEIKKDGGAKNIAAVFVDRMKKKALVYSKSL